MPLTLLLVVAFVRSPVVVLPGALLVGLVGWTTYLAWPTISGNGRGWRGCSCNASTAQRSLQESAEGPPPRPRQCWDGLHETMRPRRPRALQAPAAARDPGRRVGNVPFYRELLAREGIRPEEIRTLDDVRKLPFTKKQDLRDGYPFGFFAVPAIR